MTKSKSEEEDTMRDEDILNYHVALNELAVRAELCAHCKDTFASVFTGMNMALRFEVVCQHNDLEQEIVALPDAGADVSMSVEDAELMQVDMATLKKTEVELLDAGGRPRTILSRNERIEIGMVIMNDQDGTLDLESWRKSCLAEIEKKLEDLIQDQTQKGRRSERAVLSGRKKKVKMKS